MTKDEQELLQTWFITPARGLFADIAEALQKNR